MGIENATSIIIETNYYDIGFWVDLAAAAVIVVLIWQVWEFRKQGNLAYDPLLVVRFVEDDMGKPFVRIENVGHGTAVNVKLEILNAGTKAAIKNFNAFALQRGGGRTSVVSFEEYPRVMLKGTYQNIIGKTIHTTENIFDFDELKKGL